MTKASGLVLVTGGTGHLGANLIHLLSERGVSVRALSRGLTSPASLADLPHVQHLSGNVNDLPSLRRACADVDVVYHLAAKISLMGDPDGSVSRTNVEGTRNVLQAARQAGVRRVVHCSSVHAFDYAKENQNEITESSPLVDESSGAPAYDMSKAAAQRLAREAAHGGLDVVIVHPSGVLGPRDFRPSPLGRAFLKMEQGKLPGVTAGGFDFVDARDVAQGMLSAAEKGRTGENYLLTGAYASIRTLAETAATITGVPAPRHDVPLWVAQLAAPPATWSARIFGTEPQFTTESLRTLRLRASFNSTKAERELGYTRRPLSESIRDLYTDFARRGLCRPPLSHE